MNKRHLAIEVTPGKILRTFTREETQGLRQKWIDVFCKRKQGANIKAYLWHIFSYERYPALSGEEALEEYSRRNEAEYVVLSNYNELAVETNLLPKYSNTSDFYVFPRNMAWTMAFTHEDGWLGPYFATHPNKEKLEEENMKKVQKLKEIENAKKKGWI